MNIASQPQLQPIGYFVHHQGRGHAERCAALVNALPIHRPVRVFCARDDIFPPLRPGVAVVKIPSLFEPSGDERFADTGTTPATVHCAPLGWPGIRQATATLTGWFASAHPALMICDVSAEIAQLARLCSVPHVKVLQHGTRSDPGHMAAYDGALGLLVPGAKALSQPDWTQSMLAKTHFAGGLGLTAALPHRRAARGRIGLALDQQMILVLSGGGGSGTALAPLGVGARALPRAQWITIGHIERNWHATEPANLRHDGWVENVADYLCAADVIISSTGNTTCQQILAAGKPWIAVPEWRYFDEQVQKAKALDRVGLAHVLPMMPASAQAWQHAIRQAMQTHDPARQTAMVDEQAADTAAQWIEALIAKHWTTGPVPAGHPLQTKARISHD